MPMSTIFQIVEIGTARSAQCDLGFSHLLFIITILGARMFRENLQEDDLVTVYDSLEKQQNELVL